MAFTWRDLHDTTSVWFVMNMVLIHLVKMGVKLFDSGSIFDRWTCIIARLFVAASTDLLRKAQHMIRCVFINRTGLILHTRTLFHLSKLRAWFTADLPIFEVLCLSGVFPFLSFLMHGVLLLKSLHRWWAHGQAGRYYT